MLADQGICVIDEFDKIGCDHHCLLEAMEQQQVSIAKSGVVATLSARCSVLAAANPVGGHYDCSKTVTENIKMTNALLSRFDLIFVLLDKPDAEHDQRLSRHIMKTHGLHGKGAEAEVSSKTGERRSRGARRRTSSDKHRMVHAYGGDGIENLDERPLISHDVLRNYISYARRFVHPKLTGGAATVLQKLYLKVRDDARGGDSLPITTRQLESLVRLAQARARMELHDSVRASDAYDVVSLMEKVSCFQEQLRFLTISTFNGLRSQLMAILLFLCRLVFAGNIQNQRRDIRFHPPGYVAG